MPITQEQLFCSGAEKKVPRAFLVCNKSILQKGAFYDAKRLHANIRGYNTAITTTLKRYFVPTSVCVCVTLLTSPFSISNISVMVSSNNVVSLPSEVRSLYFS